MKNARLTIVLSIVAVVIGLILNFQEFLFGSSAGVRNLIGTFLYLAIWIFLIFSAAKNKNRKVLIYCFGFWIITLIFSIITVYVNATELSADWAIPFVVLLMGQFYGIDYFTNNSLFTAIVVTVISFGASLFSIFLFKRIDIAVRK